MIRAVVLILLPCLPYLGAARLGAGEVIPGGGPSAGQRAGAGLVPGLIARLGSNRFAERESAGAALEALGGPALGALRAALRNPDAEVRRRAAALVPRIELRLETARVLRPTRLRLVYKDEPVVRAVADLARRTGFPILLHGDAAKLAGRRVTVDTGETTFWEALARFGAAAGLTEHRQEGAGLPGGRLMATGKGRRIIFLDSSDLAQAGGNNGQILLQEGTTAPCPTHLAGALRIRALPAQDRPGAREVTLTLDVETEPRLGWEHVVALRVEDAFDDRGQRVRQPAPYLGPEAPAGNQETLLVWDARSRFPTNLGQRRLPLRLHLGPRPARRLQEVRGTVTGWVRTPPEPLVTVDRIARKAGAEFHGADGTLLKVVEFRRAASLLQIKVDVTSPPPLTDLVAPGIRLVGINRRGRARGLLSGKGIDPFRAPARITLLDARGRPLKLAGAEFTEERAGGPLSCTLTYLPARDGAEPARLVYTGRRDVLIEAPFVLRDVPLFKAGGTR